ncbi:MAG TPA: branched-chain amino acid ABC transporter permease [Gaiellaceae bacterium]|jgi:branched-chain amino acid transport system permease protein|nr:branched-chain amino acid ABC transporter permease [Gaiellaceae bacterium]
MSQQTHAAATQLPWQERLRATPPTRIVVRIAIAALALFVVLWVLVFADEALVKEPRIFFRVLLLGLTLAGLFFVVASGFTLIFGLMRVVNMAHGSLYLLGGYFAFDLQQRLGGGSSVSTLGFSSAETSFWDWFLPLIAASFAVGVIGLVMQQLFLRWNQGQELRQALITIAISVILADQMLAHYGGLAEELKAPTSWPTSVNVGVDFGFFRLVVLASAIAIGIGLFLGIHRTRVGMIVRAGVDDRAMVSALGINIQLVFAGAFFVGSFLAGFGGVLGGTMISLDKGNDTAFLLNSLIVVIIGGMGSLGGAAIGALALGLVDAFSDIYLPAQWSNYSILLTFVLLIAVLAVRPLGLFGRPA